MREERGGGINAYLVFKKSARAARFIGTRGVSQDHTLTSLHYQVLKHFV